jgi:hypothetical protein
MELIAPPRHRSESAALAVLAERLGKRWALGKALKRETITAVSETRYRCSSIVRAVEGARACSGPLGACGRIRTAKARVLRTQGS